MKENIINEKSNKKTNNLQIRWKVNIKINNNLFSSYGKNL